MECVIGEGKPKLPLNVSVVHPESALLVAGKARRRGGCPGRAIGLWVMRGERTRYARRTRRGESQAARRA
jgi:hypothetical protein